MAEDTHGTVTPPDAGWQIECRVALTEAEVERLTALITARLKSSWARTRG